MGPSSILLSLYFICALGKFKDFKRMVICCFVCVTHDYSLEQYLSYFASQKQRARGVYIFSTCSVQRPEQTVKIITYIYQQMCICASIIMLGLKVYNGYLYTVLRAYVKKSCISKHFKIFTYRLTNATILKFNTYLCFPH